MRLLIRSSSQTPAPLESREAEFFPVWQASQKFLEPDRVRMKRRFSHSLTNLKNGRVDGGNDDDLFSARMDSSTKRACQLRERVFPAPTGGTLLYNSYPRRMWRLALRQRYASYASARRQANHNRLIRFKLTPDRYLDARIAKKRECRDPLKPHTK